MPSDTGADGSTDPFGPAPAPPWWRRGRVEVHDQSMEPTLRPGDRLWIDRAALRVGGPRAGDLVVLVDPDAPRRWLVKRVAGVGPGRFWLNRHGLGGPAPPDEDTPPPPDSVEAVDLPAGSVFVVGDAPERSRDSRKFGPVPLERLVGRVVACYDPPGRRRSF